MQASQESEQDSVYSVVRSAPSLDKPMQIMRWAFVACLALALLIYIFTTGRWPMMVNAPVMHYVISLMKHGYRPYRDITDMNMPGAYLMESVGMALFGAGDLGWRMYDFFLLGALMASMAVIARPHDWLAGLYASGLFALRHGSEGPWFAGEREQEMTVLVAISCAALLVSVRRKRPSFCLIFGISAGLAAAVKPTLVPFGLCSLVLLVLALQRRKISPTPFVFWGAVGLLLPLAASVLYLIHSHSLHAFLFVLRAVTPIYASLNDPGWAFLIVHVAPSEWLLLFGLGALAIWRRRHWDWERGVILLAAVCGLVSYLVQQKGFWYERYMFLAFALLLIALEVLPAGERGWMKGITWTALIYSTVYLIPLYVWSFHELPRASPLTAAMEADLRHLGTLDSNGEVQCFDLTFGSLNALYHLNLIENTPFTGDLLLFPQMPNSTTDHYRQLFWNLEAKHPAKVIVFTNQEFGAENSFQRLARWPEFAEYLAQNYVLAETRSFPYEDKLRGQPPASNDTAPTYRIYLRRGQRLPALSEEVH